MNGSDHYNTITIPCIIKPEVDPITQCIMFLRKYV